MKSPTSFLASLSLYFTGGDFITDGLGSPTPPPVPLSPLAAPAQGWNQAMRIRIQAATSLIATEWLATFNDKSIPSTQDISEPFSVPYPSMLAKPNELRAWLVPANLLHEGRNTFSLTLKSEEPISVHFIDLASQTSL